MAKEEAVTSVSDELEAALGRLVTSYVLYTEGMLAVNNGGDVDLFELRSSLAKSLDDFADLERDLLGESFVKDPTGDPFPLLDRPPGGTLFDVKGTWRIVVDDVAAIREAAAKMGCGDDDPRAEQAVVALVDAWAMSELALGEQAMPVYSHVTCSQVDRPGEPFAEQNFLFTEKPKKRKKKRKKK